MPLFREWGPRFAMEERLCPLEMDAFGAVSFGDDSADFGAFLGWGVFCRCHCFGLAVAAFLWRGDRVLLVAVG